MPPQRTAATCASRETFRRCFACLLAVDAGRGTVASHSGSGRKALGFPGAGARGSGHEKPRSERRRKDISNGDLSTNSKQLYYILRE
jgi:hypothetical protein